MDHATDTSVRGDFNNTSFDYNGVHSRFFRKEGKFFAETDGPDGKLATFEVKYTFGVDPLQQYLIEFPDGRIQALSIAWDTRPKTRAANAGIRSSRARCSRQGSHAATATNPTPPSSELPETMSVCNVTQPINMQRLPQPSSKRKSIGRLRILPHAHSQLHGNRPPSRS
jgi:hypothetical protein